MKVLYVLKRYPRLSETFVVREILGVERAGVPVLVDALNRAEDGPRHPQVDQVRAAVRYLPRRPQVVGDHVLAAAATFGLRRPGVLVSLAASATVASWRERHDAQAVRRHWRTLGLALLVADRARRHGVTHIHAHFATVAAEVAVRAGRLARLPVTVTAHAKDVFHQDNAHLLVKRLERVAAVVTVSAYNREHLARTLPRARVVHVPNGVPLAPINRLGVGAPTAPVLCVARLVAKKGVDTLLEAVAIAAADDPELRLEVIGSGPLHQELVARADRLGITERVRWWGGLPADEVERAYARCAVVALPCRVDEHGDRDGLPTVLVEALARGIPVISTDVVGVPELVRHGQTGLLVAPDDPHALAAALTKLRSDPDLARSLGRCGRDLVADSYDPGDAARALCRTWIEVTR